MRSNPFTVGLLAGQAVTSPVTITFSDGGKGGTFIPSTAVLSNSSPTATFVYLAPAVGSFTISATNDGGLTNPASVSFTAKVATAVTTYVLSGPTSGTVAESSAPFTITLGPGLLSKSVQITPSASNGAGASAPVQSR